MIKSDGKPVEANGHDTEAAGEQPLQALDLSSLAGMKTIVGIALKQSGLLVLRNLAIVVINETNHLVE
jgi:hypothetical protein